MKIGVIILIVWLFLPGLIKCQSPEIDSLRKLIKVQDSADLILTFNKISSALNFYQSDEGEIFARQALKMSTLLRNETAGADAANNLGRFYFQKGLLDSASSNFQLALKKETKYPNRRIRLNAMTGLGDIFTLQGRYDSAEIILNQALKLASEKEQYPYLAAIYNGLANIANDKANFEEALDLYFKSVKYYQKTDDAFNTATVLNNIGTVLMSVKAYAKAIIYLDSALKINERFNFRGGILQTCNNLGSSYYQLDSFDISKKYLLKALEIARLDDNKQDMAAAYLTLGKMLITAKKYHQARKYLDSSYRICKKFDLKYGLMINNFTLGKYFLQMNQNDSAIYFYKCSLKQIDKLVMDVECSAIYENLYNIYKISGATDSALRYHELYTITMDSINQKKVQQQIAELEIKYRNERNLNEIQKLNESMYYLQSRTRLYIIGFLLIVSALLFYILIRKHKNKTFDLKNRLFEKEQENLRIELEVRERKLTINAMHMIRVNEVSYFVSSKLKSLLPQVNHENNSMLIELINELDYASKENVWEEFETRFKNVHQDFNNNLIHQYPELTPTEVKICSFIRLNLTNKDIAVITKRSLRTVENTRNRIRKKMNLDKDANLTRLLLSI